MFSDEVVEVRGRNLFDMLCAQLGWLVQYEGGEGFGVEGRAGGTCSSLSI